MHPQSAAANSAWLALSLADWVRLRRSLEQPAAAQQAVLNEILGVSGGTPALPDRFEDLEPQDWDDVAPLISRVAAGEANVLTRQQITHFEPTSGSNSASKLIPSTPLFRKQFNRAIHAWIADLFMRHPQLVGGPSYWSISPAVTHEPTAAGIRVGYEDDSEYLGQFGKWLVRQTLVVPSMVRKLAANEFKRATLLLLLAKPELRLISVWNPTFLSSLMEYFDTHADELLAELADGVEVCGRRLRRKVGREPWPRLALISCWADGHAGSQLAGLRRWFPKVALQPKGLLATEAFVSLPFQGHKVLAVTSHYLEFETDDHRLLRVGQLREGDEATVVVTTGGGLIRYRLGDRIAVTGFLGKTPCVDFLGRQDLVSDLCGEKLSEAFVSAIVAKLAGEGFSMLAPDGDGYTLYTTSTVDADVLEARLAANFQYAWAVQLGQLRPVRVVSVSDDAAQIYIDVRRSRGQRLGDIKPAALDKWNGWNDAFAAAQVCRE